jgi:hypothetical protein
MSGYCLQVVLLYVCGMTVVVFQVLAGLHVNTHGQNDYGSLIIVYSISPLNHNLCYAGAIARYPMYPEGGLYQFRGFDWAIRPLL